MALTYVNQIGAPEGLNQAMPANTIPDTFVRWAQDALFDRVGTMRRRGPFGLVNLTTSNGSLESQPTPLTITTSEKTLGLVATKNPLGEQVMALFVHNNAVDAVDPSSRATIKDAIKVYAYDSTFRTKSTSTVRTFATTDVDFTCDSTAIFYSSPALGGGSWISILDNYTPASSSNAQTLVYWRGGIGKETATAGITCAIGVTGSAAQSTYTDQITSSALFNDITSGMFVFDVVSGEDYYLGIVKSVDSTSAVTLEKKALRTALGSTDNAGTPPSITRTIRFTNTRPYIHNHGRGLLTSPIPANGSAITSGNEGGSGEGHWKSAGLDATWALYKNSDHTWVGNVGTITTNASGTLSTTHFNSNLTAFANEEYVAYPVSYTMNTNAQASVAQRSTQKFTGVFAATYQGYQWYANCGVGGKGNRIVFSASSNPESVDLSKDAADSIELPGTKEIRGIAASSAGLLVFTADKTFIIRGNERNNFSLEELYPEGCLCASSIVEYGGGVFWVGKSGFLLYDGGSTRLLTGDNLGVFYTDSIKNFNPSVDRIYSFFYKNYLFVYFSLFQTPFTPQRYEPLYVTGWTTTSGIDNLQWSALDDAFEWDDFKNDSKTPVYWDSQKMFETLGSEGQGIAAQFDTNNTVFGVDETSLYKFGPLNLIDGMLFALYLPTSSVTTISNMDFQGAAILETTNGTNCFLGVRADINNNIHARIIDLDPVIDTNTTGRDPILIYNAIKTEALYRKGPDFYIQTKAYTVGDPVLKKWFQRLMFNMKLNDGAVRFDIIDDEDNDDVNITLKSHRNWELFTPKGYNWSYVESIIFPKYVAANTTNWGDVYDQDESWVDLLDPAFERFKKRFSWRSNSAGIRLYQLNNYEAPNTPDGKLNLPTTVEVSSWNVGFKPMREGRQ